MLCYNIIMYNILVKKQQHNFVLLFFLPPQKNSV